MGGFTVFSVVVQGKRGGIIISVNIIWIHNIFSLYNINVVGKLEGYYTI